MATYINTNMTSLSTQNVLSKSQNELSKSIHRLSTGLRVNSAIDDASGYAIANRLNAQLRGQTVAIRNTNDAISFSQYKESALSTMHDSLQRMRELAVQSSSGTIGEEERNLLNAEFLQLQQEITRVQNNSYYNGTNALGDQSVTVQVGADSTKFDKIEVAGIKLDKLAAAANTGAPNQKAAPLANTYTLDQFNDFVKKAVADQSTYGSNRAGDWYYNQTNGHIYRFVEAGLTGANASTNAATMKVNGVAGVEDQSGYLVTITNGAENSFVANIVAQRGTAWINVNDRTSEGTYVIDGNAPTGEANTKITYSNYAGGEPNNWGGAEDSTHMYTNGQWNDLFETSVLPYVVEFGGKTINTTASNSIQAVTVSAATNGTTAQVNGMNQWQVKTAGTFTVPVPNGATAGADSADFYDQYGVALKTGEVLAQGQFVYTKGTATAVPNAALTAVTSVSSTTASSTAALIAGNAGGVNILTQLDSQQAISMIDSAMQQVEVAQIQEGATQSRLNTIVSTLTATNESLTNARSTILDTDYAAETAALARAQILQQAGIAMLAQANQLGQNVMKLLQ